MKIKNFMKKFGFGVLVFTMVGAMITVLTGGEELGKLNAESCMAIMNGIQLVLGKKF